MSAYAIPAPAGGISIGGAQFGNALSKWQRRRLGRIMRDIFEPHANPLKRWLSAMSGFSEAIAEKTLGHMWGKTSFTMPAEQYLALLTSVPTASSTGESIESTEATYTSYIRLKLDLTKFKLTKAATSTIKNELALTFAECTGLEKTVIAWAATEKKRGEACNINMWGTASSTVISTTQTPPTIGPEKLVGELK